MIVYPIGSSGQRVVLTDGVIDHFLKHRQLKWWQAESGGQLFARIEWPEIVIVEATGPRATDRRTRTSYLPDRNAEKREIVERHNRGLHFVGDWHTHPTLLPQPSGQDLVSMAECFARSTHNLNGFLMVIVGRGMPPDALHVSIHDGTEHHRLIALDQFPDQTPT